ncbi:MAG: tetratricopeptide repeat protein, partial [Proteobacteria bacterium]|nr:tetratricopeptide repeat protein [Pseudomonadota bacterium]
TQTGLGRYGNAENTFEKLIEKDPDYNQALYFLGDAYGKHGRLDDAHYYLGLYYKNEGNFKNAEFHLNKALKTDDPDKKLKIKEMLKEISKKSSPKEGFKGSRFKGSRVTNNYIRSKWENCIINVPRPWVADLNEVE